MATTFGKLLRELRQKKELYLKNIAEAMGWSVVYLSDIERGNRKPPSESDIKKMAAFMGVNPEKLLDCASKERGFIEFDLKRMGRKQADAALCLARRFETLNEEQLDKLMSVLDDEK